MASPQKPWRAEYAKSSRSLCKTCKSPITKENFRLGKLVQATQFDSVMPMWNHASCILKKTKQIKSVDDVEGIESLRWEDQIKIRKYVESGAGNSTSTSTSSTANNAKLEYGIEVSQTSRAGCRKCSEKILKGEVRIISKPEGPSNKGLMWHHAKCFLEMSSSTELESLSGWKNIPDSDQEALLPLVKKALPAAKTETAEACHSNSKLGTKRRNDSGDNEKSKLAKTSFDMSTSGAFQKQPGKFLPLDIDYGVNKQVAKKEPVQTSSNLAPPLIELMKMLFDVETYRSAMMEFEINMSEMPLGKLSKHNIQKGFEALTEIQKLLTEGDPQPSIKESLLVDASNIFFTMIPSIHPHIIRDEDDFKSKVKMLGALQDIEIASRIVGFGVDSIESLDDKYKKLRCDISPLPHDSEDYRLIGKYLNTTHSPTHTAGVITKTQLMAEKSILLIIILVVNSSSATAEATNLNLDEQRCYCHSVDHPAGRSLLQYFEPIMLVMFLVVIVGVRLIKTFSSWCKSRKDRKGVTGILDPPGQKIDEYDDVVDPPEEKIDEYEIDENDVVNPSEQKIDEYEIDEYDDVVNPSDQKIDEVNAQVDSPGPEVEEYSGIVYLCMDDKLGSGKKLGKIFLSDNKIEDGSKGKDYVVHVGKYDTHRPAAVKVFYPSHCETENEMDITIDVTQIVNEIQILYISDSHANVIRLYGFERQKDSAWLCLEQWKYRLDRLVRSAQNAVPEEAIWKAVGDPSPLMISLIRDIVSGLQHLHCLRIIHRNLTPSNVLITESLVAKLSDMRISKQLPEGKSFLDHHATCFGCPEWQAPELLRKEDETYATDMFRLGCVIFFALTGHHPFGPARSRDANIRKNNRINFFQVKHHEASHLINILLNPMSNLRPTSTEVLCHPMFWSSLKRLFFLRDASNRVEVADTGVLTKLWNREKQVLGLPGWNKKLDNGLINYIQSQRHYDYKSLRQLLRLVRNMTSHFWELPVAIQGLLGTYPEGLDSYFTGRFPKLLIAVYEVIYEEFKEESAFKMYFKESTI